jgi:hypothetical protein
LNLIRVMPAKGAELPMPEYIRAHWKHNHPDEPVEMHYEVLPDRAVPRMVEVFADGRAEADALAWHAPRYPLFQGISLIDGDMPTAAELRAKTAAESPGMFEIFESTQLEFEKAFRNAKPLIKPKDEVE